MLARIRTQICLFCGNVYEKGKFWHLSMCTMNKALRWPLSQLCDQCSRFSSTLRTLLRRYKLPVVSCSSPSCLRTAAPTYTRYGYSSGSDSRSVESTPSVSPYHGYVGSRISSPTDRFVSDFGPPNAGLSAEPSPTSSTVDSQACTTLDKAFVKCEHDKHGAESYYSRSVAFPKRPKLEVIEPAESVPVSPSPDSASLARMRRWSPRDDRVLEPEADDNRVIGPAGGLMSSARSPETRSCRIVTESRDASIQCDLASEDATCSAMPESVTSPETSCRCQYCGITFDDDVMYSIHMGCHNHRDPFICNVCGKRSDNKYTFYTHIMRGHEYSWLARGGIYFHSRSCK